MVATHAQTDAAAESEDSGTDGYFTAEEGYPTADSDTEELQGKMVNEECRELVKFFHTPNVSYALHRGKR